MTEKNARDLLRYMVIYNIDNPNKMGTVMDIGRYGFVVRWGWGEEEVISFTSPTVEKLVIK